VRRLGSESERAVDVRVVCATHTDLPKAVQAGAFREDLFYRIHRLVIDVPPLRKRAADILPLCEHLLASMRSQTGIAELDRGALERLCAHPWPGNVRELRNVLEVAVLESHGGIVDQGAIERALRRTSDVGPHALSSEAVREALTRYGGNVSATARALGVPRSTLRDRMKVDGIER
jgi:DNA-binding NtrC family response regulator